MSLFRVLCSHFPRVPFSRDQKSHWYFILTQERSHERHTVRIFQDVGEKAFEKHEQGPELDHSPDESKLQNNQKEPKEEHCT